MFNKSSKSNIQPILHTQHRRLKCKQNAFALVITKMGDFKKVNKLKRARIRYIFPRLALQLKPLRWVSITILRLSTQDQKILICWFKN